MFVMYYFSSILKYTLTYTGKFLVSPEVSKSKLISGHIIIKENISKILAPSESNVDRGLWSPQILKEPGTPKSHH